MRGNNRMSISFEMSDSQYIKLKTIIHEYAGINLGDDKRELLLARLGKLFRKRGIPGFAHYMKILGDDDSGDEITCLLDTISTNVTRFFREEEHFSFLAGEIERNRLRGLPRVWSAGCSSGEEAYSIAMTILEHSMGEFIRGPLVFGTDISSRMIAMAREGVYPHSSIGHLDPSLVKKYFLKGTNTAEGMVRVKRELAEQVVFQRLNFMESFDSLSSFRFIFCRNVMIYFDAAIREELVARFHSVLETGGFLITGHSESLHGVSHSFRYIRPTVYQKI